MQKENDLNDVVGQLLPEIGRGVSEAGYTTPSPIQEQTIPSMLTGRDIISCAQTGSGKAATFPQSPQSGPSLKVEIGKMNTLRVLRSSDFGLFLDGGQLGDVLLPRRYVSNDWKPGDSVEIFVMHDSEDRLTATTQKPYAMVDEFANLRVVSVTGIGAFLDWGMPKDLLVPFREQAVRMSEGQSYLVRIYLDCASGRLAASSKLDRFLNKTDANYKTGEKVDLLIGAKTDLGYKAIINGTHWGVIFHNEVFHPLERGRRIEGFIKQLRPDGKIDLCLQKPGYEKVTRLADTILQHMEKQGGFMPVTIKSSPEEIYKRFGVSKKTYKQAIGALYKKRLIKFTDGGTKMADA